ncbi:ABC transporter ATP-binding protein [Slackia heliotrinireducens]|uniref:ABC transporter ATP-binding protein n=1 Tax=Slackia heliotrinireducens TaxID=84110 RepID=UPI003314A70B
MKILKFLKGWGRYVLVIAVLLLVQATADLALPKYTADLVDVGIQQSGIESSAPDEMRNVTYDAVMKLAGDDAETIEASYNATDDLTHVINDYGKAHRAELEAAVARPLMLASIAGQAGIDPTAFEDEQAIRQMLENAPVDNRAQTEAITALVDGSMDPALVQQYAAYAVKAEYDAIGKDTTAIQMGYLFRIGGIMLAIAAIMMAASVAVGYVASRTAAGVGRDLRRRLFTNVVSFSDKEVQSFSVASLITRGTNDIQQIQNVIAMGLRMVLYAPILAIGGIVMITRTNTSMSWIIVLGLALVAVVVGTLFAIVMPKFRIVQKQVDRVNQVAREMLNGISVVRAFNRQAFERQTFETANSNLKATQLFTNRAMVLMMPFISLIMNGMSVLIVWMGASKIDTGVIQTGDLIAFITYAMVIMMSFMIIGMMSIIIPRAEISAQRIDEVLTCETSIRDPEEFHLHPAAAQPGGVRVTFEDVSFAFAEDSEPALSHISFEAAPGTTTAIIGSTGSGKSTLLKLIERFYDVTDGRILVDGVDVRDIPLRDLRSQFGYVPQQSFLFSGSVAENVAYGEGAVDMDVVRAATDVAQATEFVEKLPEGFDTEVSQGGTNVSGGQRQRLSIARALASKPRGYLFDDSFSALDFKTDAALRRALDSQMGEATVIIVAQRIATVMNADNILVLDNGEIVGSGTHAELLERCPTYLEIAQSQLSESELKGGGR